MSFTGDRARAVKLGLAVLLATASLVNLLFAALDYRVFGSAVLLWNLLLSGLITAVGVGAIWIVRSHGDLALRRSALNKVALSAGLAIGVGYGFLAVHRMTLSIAQRI